MKKASETRTALIALSNALSIYVESGMFDSMNEALIKFYSDEVNTDFKKFKEWKAERKKIKKGSKAFCVWARPLNAKKTSEEKTEKSEEDEYKYFPICYLFSNAQVE